MLREKLLEKGVVVEPMNTSLSTINDNTIQI